MRSPPRPPPSLLVAAGGKDAKGKGVAPKKEDPKVRICMLVYAWHEG